MVGPFINAAGLAVGAILGASCSKVISQNLKDKMPLTFGLASMAMGITMIVKVKLLPAAILALLLGTIIGELIHLEAGIGKVAGLTRGVVDKIIKPREGGMSQEEFSGKFVAILVLFAASGTGIFGAMNEGMTGDMTMLLAKASLDFFTAAIFATGMGYSVVVLAIPLLFVQSVLFYAGAAIIPMTTPTMIADFSAVGGFIMFATGFRICGIKPFPIANMLPALFIVMPISSFWINTFMVWLKTF